MPRCVHNLARHHARRWFLRGLAHGILRTAHVRRHCHNERELNMGKRFFGGFLLTLVFVVVISAALFGIFTLVSYIAGPVGG